MSKVTVNEDRLEEWMTEHFEENEVLWYDWEDFSVFIYDLVSLEASVFNLPTHAEAVVYEVGGEPGFIFGLRPSTLHPNPFELGFINVSTFTVESRDIEPRDEEGRLPVDGGELDDRAACRQVAENVASVLNELAPAYQKLWG